MKRLFVPVIAIMALMLGAVTAHGQTENMQASAEIMNADGESVGMATFSETDGGVEINVEVNNLGPGPHGIHLHQSGVCEAPDFESAGDHFNPDDQEHGLENPAGPHAGDLPNIEINDDGTGTLNYTNDMITLGEGSNSILDDDGTAILIHSDEDDLMTDPSGESGDPIACGEVMADETNGMGQDTNGTDEQTDGVDDDTNGVDDSADADTDMDRDADTDTDRGGDTGAGTDTDRGDDTKAGGDQMMPAAGSPVATADGQAGVSGLLILGAAAGALMLVSGVILRARETV